MQTQPFNARLHYLAVITAVATFPLIFMGGLVTSHHAGMSVPDWPNTWGYNMFTFPISQWKGGILFEHTHRLAATFIGLLTIALVIVAFRTDHRKWIRLNAIGLLIAVFLQGCLGGLRVVLNERDLAIIHGCVAQLFFCYAVTFCVMTSKFFTNRVPLSGDEYRSVVKATRLTLFTTGVIFAQLIIGAIMRHSDAGLAIPDFPASFGHLLPPFAIDNAFRQQAIHDYGINLGLNSVTMFQIWIHFTHRIGALLVTTMVLWSSLFILTTLPHRRALTIPAIVLLTFLPIQLTLGILTVLLRKPADIASMHVAVGALVLVTAWMIVVRSFILLRTRATLPTENARAFVSSTIV